MAERLHDEAERQGGPRSGGAAQSAAGRAGLRQRRVEQPGQHRAGRRGAATGAIPGSAALTDREVRLRLRRILRYALGSASSRHSQVFLEFFAGTAGMSRAMRAQGLATISVDTLKQPWLDLNRRVVQTTFLGWISSNV
eukprot:9478211-Pyramimonas_sp.AAC.1